MRFTKLHGLGNDFILVDRLKGEPPFLGVADARALCDRRRGIGADGVLLLTPARTPGSGALARMEVLNADGSIAEMCGNGLRCVALYLHRHLRPASGRFMVETGAGPRSCEVDPAGEEVEIGMGHPSLQPSALPMRRASPLVGEFLDWEGERFLATAVSMGNPHLILFDVDPARAATLGPRLEHHPLFPERANISFARVLPEGTNTIELTVWERGAGLTQACGTGACATAVAAVLAKRVPADLPVTVCLPGGPLRVTVRTPAGALEPIERFEVQMRGPARFVFEGEIAFPFHPEP